MLRLWCVLVSLVTPSTSYRILGFFPFPATSHHNAIAPILHRLASAGHEVVYLTPVPPKISHPNLDVRLMKGFIKEYLEKLNIEEFGSASVPVATSKLYTTAVKTADLHYGSPQAQEIIHGSDKFDAVMMEAFALEPVSALIHKFGCVGIEVSTMGDLAWLNELSGIPDNPVYQIDFKQGLTDTMTFFERMQNFISTWLNTLTSYYYLIDMQVVMDQYFNYTGWESRPHISKLISNRSLVLINKDIVLGYPYPVAPHVQNLGGLNLVPNKPLPKNIKTFMDEAPNGVILFSLGSNLRTSEISSTNFGKAFFSVFEEIPQRILMKWETDEVPEFIAKSKNIMTLKWLPQQDILAHEKCVLFITHGGYQSLTETVYHGVPIVGIPFFGDQPKNLKLARRDGYGVLIRSDNITQDSVRWAINEIINNPRYKKEAKRRSSMMKERRHSGLDDALYWIEFAIKYPFVLTPRSAYLSFVQLHQIDIFAFIFVCLYITYKLTSLLIRSVKNKTLIMKEKIL